MTLDQEGILSIDELRGLLAASVTMWTPNRAKIMLSDALAHIDRLSELCQRLEVEKDTAWAAYETARGQRDSARAHAAQAERDHEAMEAIRQGRIELVKRSVCASCGPFCAWGHRCHYAADPAEAILEAAKEHP